MPKTFIGSDLSVPASGKAYKSGSFKPKVGQTVSSSELVLLNQLSQYRGLMQTIEMFKNLFVDHDKNKHLQSLIAGLEKLTSETKDQVKLDLVKSLKNN
jgi:hypothetical protein